jgi:hypothetical protein
VGAVDDRRPGLAGKPDCDAAVAGLEPDAGEFTRKAIPSGSEASAHDAAPGESRVASTDARGPAAEPCFFHVLSALGPLT